MEELIVYLNKSMVTSAFVKTTIVYYGCIITMVWEIFFYFSKANLSRVDPYVVL